MEASPANAPRLLITAGPTWEPIDAVRYLTNRSSGRMGLALAQSSIRRSWPTTLLLGPTPLPPPDTSHCSIRRFQTTAQLQALLVEHWPSHDVLLMAAAVADYRPADVDPTQKRPRRGQGWHLALEPTPDLLAHLARTSRPDQTLIGFALEPADRLIESARRKLAQKHLDAIVANDLTTMDSDTIIATLLLRDGRTLSPGRELEKVQFANWLLDELATIRAAARTARA
ncbi:MAG: phosphopantothenoylcysteine decarboxylase [Phycisphaerales bacterium]